MPPAEAERASLGPVRGGALYVGALLGPGVLLVPALAVQAAGAASIVAWAALLVLSAPLAITFAALGIRHPDAGGVSSYVRAGLGDHAAAVTGIWFLTAVVIGAPTVALIGGLYVADLTGAGTTTAALVGLAILATVLTTNAFGVRVSATVQLALAGILVALLVTAVAVALPSHGTDHWTPFAPHGWWSVGTAANILIWMFVGWEAVAQLVGEFREPERDLPRSMAIAFAIVTVIYVGLAVATIGVSGASASRVPLADLMSVGFGRGGRDVTAVAAVALTMGTMNVYISGTSRLVGALALEGALPPWFARDAHARVPRRALGVLGAVSVVVLVGLIAGLGSTATLVRATSACFIAVYLLSILSAFRILQGRIRIVAASALVFVALLAVFSAWYLAVPAVAAGVVLLARRRRIGVATLERSVSRRPSA